MRDREKDKEIEGRTERDRERVKEEKKKTLLSVKKDAWLIQGVVRRGV